MNLSTSQRQYLLVGQCLVPGALNFVINGLIAWIMFRSLNPVPMWQLGLSVGFDTIATGALLPALTGLIVTPIVRRHVRAGKVEPAVLPRWLLPLRRSLAVRTLLLGLAGLTLAGLIVVGLMLAGVTGFAPTPVVWVKASFTAVLGALVTPIIALLALADVVEGQTA